jgi:hypothetical protein
MQYNVLQHKIVYCYKYTSCTRQSIVEREGLQHDERSEEFDNMSCATSVLLGTNYFGRQSQLTDIKL